MSLTIAPGKTRIGWIGTGVMGRSMCGHLIDRGFAMTITSRTKSKADTLLTKGAKWKDSPKAVAEQSDIAVDNTLNRADIDGRDRGGLRQCGHPAENAEQGDRWHQHDPLGVP